MVRQKNAGDTASNTRHRTTADEKIARLPGLLLVKDMKRRTDQVPLLRSAGFEVSEVAELLGMTKIMSKWLTITGVRIEKPVEANGEDQSSAVRPPADKAWGF